MRQDETPREGDVEVDETAGGGRIRAGGSRKGRQHVIAKMSRRPTVWAAVERGGRVKARVVRSRSTTDIEPPIFQYVLPTSMIFTDEWLGYTHRVGSRYIAHKRIRHEDRVYVSGDVHTQTVEGFFSTCKNGIRGPITLCRANGFSPTSTSTPSATTSAGNTTRSMFETLLERAAA